MNNKNRKPQPATQAGFLVGFLRKRKNMSGEQEKTNQELAMARREMLSEYAKIFACTNRRDALTLHSLLNAVVNHPDWFKNLNIPQREQDEKLKKKIDKARTDKSFKLFLKTKRDGENTDLEQMLLPLNLSDAYLLSLAIIKAIKSTPSQSEN